MRSVAFRRRWLLALALWLACTSVVTFTAAPAGAAPCAPPCAHSCRKLSGWPARKLKRTLHRAVKDLRGAYPLRRAAIHTAVDILAVNASIKPSGQRRGDHGRMVIRLRVPLVRETLEALAAALLDPDAGVQRCAAGALDRLVFGFGHPPLPTPGYRLSRAVSLPLAKGLKKAPGPARRAAALLLLAAGHHGATGDLNTGGLWNQIAPTLSGDQLALLTRSILGILDRPGPRPAYWQRAASSALHHILEADEARRHGEATLQVAAARNRFHRARRPFPPHVAEGRVLGSLLRGSLDPARKKQAFAILARRMVARINLIETIPLMGHFQDPGQQVRAARLLEKRLHPRETMITGKAAVVLARLSSAGAQAVAAKGFSRVFGGGGHPIVLKKICNAVSEMTHGPSQATLLGGVTAVVKSKHDHYIRGPAILALGRMIAPRAQMKAVKILRLLTRDIKVRIRSNAAHAIGLLRDPAAQARGIGEVIAALKDPDGLTRVEATRSLGQFSEPAARQRARKALLQLRSSLAAGVPLAPQLRRIAACALEQLDGRRQRAVRCRY